jgi:hypothetical protein
MVVFLDLVFAQQPRGAFEGGVDLRRHQCFVLHVIGWHGLFDRWLGRLLWLELEIGWKLWRSLDSTGYHDAHGHRFSSWAHCLNFPPLESRVLLCCMSVVDHYGWLCWYGGGLLMKTTSIMLPCNRKWCVFSWIKQSLLGHVCLGWAAASTAFGVLEA